MKIPVTKKKSIADVFKARVRLPADPAPARRPVKNYATSYGARGSASSAEQKVLARAADVRKSAAGGASFGNAYAGNNDSYKASPIAVPKRVASGDNNTFVNRTTSKYSGARYPNKPDVAARANETGSSNATEGAQRRKGSTLDSSNQYRINHNMGGTPFLAGQSNATPGNRSNPPVKKGSSSNGPSRNSSGSNNRGGSRNPADVVRAAVGKPPVKGKPVVKAPVAKPGAKTPVPVTPGTNTPTAPIPAAGPPIDPYEEFRKQATSIYQPQTDYLSGQEQTTKDNAATATANLGKDYTGLVKGIQSRVPVGQANYKAAQDNVDTIDTTAKNAINANYEASRNSQADTLKRLGIEAAAPATMQPGVADQGYYTSAQDSRGAATKRFLNSESAASSDYTNAQANISAQTGVDKQAGVARDLQGLLGQLSGKKADVQSSISSQTIALKGASDDRKAAQAKSDNEMAMAQQKLNSDTAIAKAKNALAAATSQKDYDLKYKQLQATIDNNQAGSLLGQAKLTSEDKRAAAANALKASSGNADRKLKSQEIVARAAQQAADRAAKNAPKVSPDAWASSAELANRIYPNRQAAGNAVKAIRDTVIANKGVKFASAGDFIQAMVKRNPQANHAGGDMPQLTQLATQIYKSIYG